MAKSRLQLPTPRQNKTDARTTVTRFRPFSPARLPTGKHDICEISVMKQAHRVHATAHVEHERAYAHSLLLRAPKHTPTKPVPYTRMSTSSKRNTLHLDLFVSGFILLHVADNNQTNRRTKLPQKTTSIYPLLYGY